MYLLDELVSRYINEEAPIEDKDLFAYKNCEDIEHLIKRAVAGITHDGKRDSHKSRREHVTLRSMKDYLMGRKNEIICADSFEKIMEIVYESKIYGFGYGFGPLSIYDTALNISVYFGYLPNEVHLHCGALEGAQNLLGKSKVRKQKQLFMDDNDFIFLKREDFPKEVRRLEPYHIENFLCHYRKELK